jgi:alpha-ketoglutarate-dependent taurine dioxygenase
MNKDESGAARIPFVLSRRKAVLVSSDELVSIGFPESGQLPMIVRPRTRDTNMITWANSKLGFINSELQRHGAILFRGFPLRCPEHFHKFVQAVSGEAEEYRERSSPRSEVLDRIYTSTDYPSDQRILPHNEHSYSIVFPRKLYFWCEIAAARGGETPLGDVRRVLTRIDRSVAEKFIEKGWMLVRNLTPHFALSWQTVFQTNDPGKVEEYCRKSMIEWEWTASGLRTRQVRPAVAIHPGTGEKVWFNHAAFFHISSVEANLRRFLQSEYSESELPTNTYYGDGSPIEYEVAEHLREAYEAEMVSFSWEAGDVVLIDNMLTAHGRGPFVGPRRILFAMADLYTRPDMASEGSEVGR